jgi:hypothetical protein
LPPGNSYQVGRELDAAEAQRQRLRQPADEQRLGQARHPDQQRMPPREQADRQLLDHLVLPDDDLAQLRVEPLVDLPQFVNGRNVVLWEERSLGGVGHGASF